jgi:hypothetical protein
MARRWRNYQKPIGYLEEPRPIRPGVARPFSKTPAARQCGVFFVRLDNSPQARHNNPPLPPTPPEIRCPCLLTAVDRGVS